MNDDVRTAELRQGPVATASEAARIEFLKLVVNASEGHLRALDTKAQILLAAVVLSWNPLWSMVNSPCRNGVALQQTVVLVVACMLVATILAFGWSVWPSGPPRTSSTSSLFYVGDNVSEERRTAYLRELQGLAMLEELASEALKLACLRDAKGKRLKASMLMGSVAYVSVLALLLSGPHCA